MKKGSSRSLRKRILTLGIINVCLVSFTLTIVGSIIVGSKLKTNSEQEAQSLAAAYSDSLGSVFDRIYFELDRLAADTEIAQNYKTMDAAQLQNYLIGDGNKIASASMFYTVSILDSNGVTYDGFDLSARDYVKQAMAGTKNISAPVFSAKDKIMTYYAIEKMNNGVADGMVFTGLDLSYFYNVINSFEENNDFNGKAFVVDKNGQYVVGSDEELLKTATPFSELAKEDEKYQGIADLSQVMAGGSTGLQEVTYYDGDQYIVAYSPVENSNGWSVGILVPGSTVDKAFFQTVLILLAVAVVAIVATIFTFSFYAKKFAEPITYAADRVKLFGEGDLHTETEIMTGTDETEMLTTSIVQMSETLSGYVNQISETLYSLSNGNLDIEITDDYIGDFAPIKKSLNEIIDSLNVEMSQIDESSLQVSTGSSNVSEAAQNLARGATQQASAIQELSATVVDISDKVNETAKNAEYASEKGAQAGKETQVSVEHMNELLQAMKDIDNASNEISKIMKTIEDIAFQTNILALNASVEAARAGEAGKGFSVVADEVRNLAGKCAQASKDTAVLIENSLNLTKRGTKLADSTSQSLDMVASLSSETVENLEKIASAAKEQAVAVNQVTQGIEQISGVVQSNSATAEESAAASEELNGQATMLKDMMNKFTLKKNILYGYDPATKEVDYMVGGKPSNNSFELPESSGNDFEFGANDKY